MKEVLFLFMHGDFVKLKNDKEYDKDTLWCIVDAVWKGDKIGKIYKIREVKNNESMPIITWRLEEELVRYKGETKLQSNLDKVTKGAILANCSARNMMTVATASVLNGSISNSSIIQKNSAKEKNKLLDKDMLLKWLYQTIIQLHQSYFNTKYGGLLKEIKAFECVLELIDSGKMDFKE